MPKLRLGQIGALVRERRGERGMRAAAREIGVSAATLSRIENGQAARPGHVREAVPVAENQSD